MSDAADPPHAFDAEAELARLPDGLLYAPEHDMWVRFEGDEAILGATHLVTEHGQFMLFMPRPDGTPVKRDRSLGVMETAKTAIGIVSPISCVIVNANPKAVVNVECVAHDPYRGGWLFRVRPTALDDERALLMDASAYREWLRPRLKERRFAPDPQERQGTDIDPLRGY